MAGQERKRPIQAGKAGEEQKKPKQAIALEYDPSEEAPRVIASGRGELAERIIELYEVVAEILIFVDSMDKIKAKMAAAK